MSNTTLSFNPSRPRGHVHSEEATEIPMGANVPFEVALEACSPPLKVNSVTLCFLFFI